MNNRPRQPRFASPARRSSRRGAVLVMAMVSLAVAAVLLVSIAKMAAAGRQAIRAEARRMQAAWLAESALERAARRLAADPAYSGETWTLTADELADDGAGLVQIRVAAVPGRPDRRLVRVRADYPNHPQHRARRSKQLMVQIPAAAAAAAGDPADGDPADGDPSGGRSGPTENTRPVEEEP